MTLRQRLYALYFGVFTLVLGFVLISIYAIYSEYRQEVFLDRLRSRIFVTTKLLFEIRTKDEYLMDVLDEHTIHSMFDEKVLIFNDSNKLVYTSIDDLSIEYSPELLNQIRRQQQWSADVNGKETLGLYYTHAGKHYVALASATDVVGERMIEHLTTALIIAFSVGVALIIITGPWFVRRSLRPIAILSDEIDTIGPSDLNIRLTIPKGNDEVSRIATAFNSTLSRLTTAFEFQTNFVHYASHELNTPISVARAVLERVHSLPQTIESYQGTFRELTAAQTQLSEVLSSLLLLAGLEGISNVDSNVAVRLDDIFFDVAEVFSYTHPHVHVAVNVILEEDPTMPFEIYGVAPLLRTAISNLLDNAAKYSSNSSVVCKLYASRSVVELEVSNAGAPLSPDEQEYMVVPFVRLSHSSGKPGKGLGLTIVHRIVLLHRGQLSYQHSAVLGNQFIVSFPAISS